MVNGGVIVATLYEDGRAENDCCQDNYNHQSVHNFFKVFEDFTFILIAKVNLNLAVAENLQKTIDPSWELAS